MSDAYDPFRDPSPKILPSILSADFATWPTPRRAALIFPTST
jgi:hypothetical protein